MRRVKKIKLITYKMRLDEKMRRDKRKEDDTK